MKKISHRATERNPRPEIPEWQVENLRHYARSGGFILRKRPKRCSFNLYSGSTRTRIAWGTYHEMLKWFDGYRLGLIRSASARIDLGASVAKKVPA